MFAQFQFFPYLSLRLSNSDSNAFERGRFAGDWRGHLALLVRSNDATFARFHGVGREWRGI